MRSKKYIISVVFILLAGLLCGLFLYNRNERLQKLSKECDNYKEIQHFKKPISIVWEARFDGCLVSCWGGVFTRITENPQYPRFSGYVPDNGNKIADEFMKEGQILKIYGKWTDVSGSYASVFGNKCVPTIEIEKIEIVKQ